MKTSTEIQSTANLVGYEKAIELIAKAGFDAWDFSMCKMARLIGSERKTVVGDYALTTDGYADYAKKLKQIGLDNGITCNQSHAPFPSFDKTIQYYIKRAIECSAIAGAEICVVHPINYYSPEKNADFYRELLDFAKQHNVKIATENMYGWDCVNGTAIPHACAWADNFLAHLNAVNDDYFVACVDIGHAEMKGARSSATDIIYTLKDKVQALHIHDVDLIHDNHATPFTLKIDYAPIVKALKDVNYKGYLTLEVDNHYVNGGYTKETAFEGAKTLFESVNKLKNMF